MNKTKSPRVGRKIQNKTGRGTERERNNTRSWRQRAIRNRRGEYQTD